MARTLFWTRFWPIWPKFGPPNFLFKNLASSVTRYHDQVSSCTIWEKTNDPQLRNLVTDGWTDGRMDGRADRRTDRRTRVISWGAFPLKSSVKEPRSEISFNFVRMKSNANRIYFMVGEISIRVSCKHPLK